METETPSVHRERIRLDWQEASDCQRGTGPSPQGYQVLLSGSSPLHKTVLYPSNHYRNVGIGYEVGGQVEGQNTEMPHRPVPKECSPG